MSDKTKSILSVSLPIILTIAVSYYIQGLIISNQEQFTGWLAQFGRYVILVYILLQIAATIIAPIGGAFLVITMIALFGPAQALILAYLVNTPCYLINFYLAKKYGRPLADKMVGKEALNKVDNFVQNTGIPMLAILRLFQSSNFDYLSYGVGLTKIPFKTFAIVNVLVGIPAAFIGYFIYSKAENLTQGVIIAYIVGAIFAFLVVGINYLKLQYSPKSS
jgi:uncharacterized membrane protein YdjX (TVP38/TMEM64 family)